jgi:hypothetical protein
LPSKGTKIRPLDKATVLPCGRGGITPQWQREQAQWLIPLLVARQPMQAVIWNQWRDDRPHDFPHGGLNDAQGKPKVALEAMIEMRKDLVT